MARVTLGLSNVVIDLFPDGYDKYGLVYASSDTDSEKGDTKCADEDCEDLGVEVSPIDDFLSSSDTDSETDNTKCADEDCEDRDAEESPIEDYFSSHCEEENDDDKGCIGENKSQVEPVLLGKSFTSKNKLSSSSKKFSKSESVLLRPPLKCITKTRDLKKRHKSLVTYENTTQVSSTLKRKRSSSEGEYILKKPKEESENHENNSFETLEKDKHIFEEQNSENMESHHSCSNNILRLMKDGTSCHDESDAISGNNISDEVKNMSLKEKIDALPSVQLSTKEASDVSWEQISDNDSNKHSLRRLEKTDRYAQKEASEDSSGTLADDESDHEEEKINFRNSSYVDSYRKNSSIDNASDKHTADLSSPEEVGESSTKKIFKNISKTSLRKNFKEELYKEKCQEDPEYPSKEVDLRKHLHATIPMEHLKKRKRSYKRRSMKTIPEEICTHKENKSSSKNNTKKFGLNKRSKKAFRRNKLLRIFMKHAKLHKTTEVKTEQEEQEQIQPVINLSEIPADQYYIDDFENSNVVGAEACIGNEEESIHENNDQPLDRIVAENQSSNSQTSPNTYNSNILSNNLRTSGDFKVDFRQPIARISANPAEQLSAVQRYEDLWSHQQILGLLFLCVFSVNLWLAFRQWTSGHNIPLLNSFSSYCRSPSKLSGGQPSLVLWSHQQVLGLFLLSLLSAYLWSFHRRYVNDLSRGLQSASQTSGGNQSVGVTSHRRQTLNRLVRSLQFTDLMSCHRRSVNLSGGFRSAERMSRFFECAEFREFWCRRQQTLNALVTGLQSAIQTPNRRQLEQRNFYRQQVLTYLSRCLVSEDRSARQRRSVNPLYLQSADRTSGSLHSEEQTSGSLQSTDLRTRCQQTLNAFSSGQQPASQTSNIRQFAYRAPGNLQQANRVSGDLQPADLASGNLQPADRASGAQQPVVCASGSQQPADRASGSQQPADRASGAQNSRDFRTRCQQTLNALSRGQQSASQTSNIRQFAYRVIGDLQQANRVSGAQQPADRASGAQQPADRASGAQNSRDFRSREH